MLSPAIPDGMDLGLFLSGHDGDMYFSHGGSNPPGFKCWLLAHKYDGYGLVVMTNSNMGGMVYEEIKRSVANTFNWTKYKPMEFDTFDALLNDLKKRYDPDPAKSQINESKINSMGYDFMGMGQTERAIEILKLNIKLFPESANCYDSLGDLYIELGDSTKAFQCYLEAVEVLRRHPVRNRGMMYLIDGYKRDFPSMFEKN